jgi:GTP-binding protein
MFTDSVEISIQGGNGGNGAVSFHRDKMTMHGGPDGGNGGHGGNVIFIGTTNIDNLVAFHYNQSFKAFDGGNGSGGNKTGARGKDLIIEVPLGTKFLDKEDKLLCDITEKDQRYTAVHGGAGGYGNAHFATAIRQTPNFSRSGAKTKPYKIRLELNCIADVGLIGFPNVGKSTLLSVISRAKPKIANYHFTTLYPNIGVVNLHGQNILFADIPGLIKGASGGVGLGINFLKHISRTRLLLHIVDISAADGRDPTEDYYVINGELKEYGAGLEVKPQIIVLNKIDSATKEQIFAFKRQFKKSEIFEISAMNHTGVTELLEHTFNVLQTLPKPPLIEAEDVLEKPVDKNQFVVSFQNGEFNVSGPFVDNLIRGVVLDDTESNHYFQKRLVDMGVISELLKIGLTDGGTINIAGHSFTYTL